MRQRGYVKPIGGYGASHVAKGPSPQPFSLMELQRLRVPPELWPGVEVDSDRKFPVRGCDISASDVMCGRGGQSNCHPGNKAYRDIVNRFRPGYASAKKFQKLDIARTVVVLVRQQKGRFLKKDEKSDLWYEIGDNQALGKTSQILRGFRVK